MSDDDEQVLVEIEVDEESRDLARRANDMISGAIFEMAKSGFFVSGISVSWHSNDTFSIDYELYDGSPDITPIDTSALIVGKEDIH